MVKKKSFGSAVNTVLTAKESELFNIGFTREEDAYWSSFGNYALNRMMSGRFDKGLMFGKNYIFYGESGSGKSLQIAYMCGLAQKQMNAYVLWIDAEKASTEEWFSKVGVSTNQESMSIISTPSLVEVKSKITEVIKMYRQAVKDEEDLPPLIIAIDSWSVLLTANQMEQAEGGELKGDQGQKAKQLGDTIVQLNHMVGNLPVLIMGVLHVYDNQDMYTIRKHRTTGGNKALYMASGALLLTKKELDVDSVEDPDERDRLQEITDNMTAEQRKKKRFAGIICKAENLKSRVSKPFQTVNVQIPYNTGIDSYSGLFGLLQEESLVRVSGKGWYVYKNSAEEEVKFQKNSFRDHADEIMRAASKDIGLENKEEVKNEK